MMRIPCADAPRGGVIARLDVSGGRLEQRRPARDALRALLAAAAGAAGDLAETDRGPVAIGSWSGIGVSLAYADDVALVAIAPGWDVGVDLVRTALVPEWRDVLRSYCGDAAAAVVASAPPAERAALFSACWARHEADLKCLGGTLAERAAVPSGTHLLRRSLTVPGFAAAVTMRRSLAAVTRAPREPSHDAHR